MKQALVAFSRRLPLVAVAAAFAVVSAVSHSDASGPARTAKTPLQPVLGISYRTFGGALAWFEPGTLRMLPGRKAPLGGYLGNWAFSADRAVLAIASCDEGAEVPAIRFVNARTMRVQGDLRLSQYRGCASSLTWLRPDRLLAVVTAAGYPDLVVVDPLARRVLRREPLPAEPWATARTQDELVLMLGTYGAFAPARVAVVDAEGTVRVATVERVLAGNVVDQSSDFPRIREISPGFAVDPAGRRAYLVPASGPVAEVDLETLAVTYHELDRPSLLTRVAHWLVPAAQAKALEGPVRTARWLGDGLIAVSGMDYSMVRISKGDEVEIGTPAGVSLIDTRSWTTHRLSGEASEFAVAPGRVIAQGGSWDSQDDRYIGPGLLAFGLDGRERWRLHAGEYRRIDPAGAVGYVYIAAGRAEVVDLATGVVLRTIQRNERRNPWPQLLAAQQSVR